MWMRHWCGSEILEKTWLLASLVLEVDVAEGTNTGTEIWRRFGFLERSFSRMNGMDLTGWEC